MYEKEATLSTGCRDMCEQEFNIPFTSPCLKQNSKNQIQAAEQSLACNVQLYSTNYNSNDRLAYSAWLNESVNMSINHNNINSNAVS